MPPAGETGDLQSGRYQTFVVRLMLDSSGRFQRGELVNATGGLICRFHSKEGLVAGLGRSGPPADGPAADQDRDAS